MPTKKKTLVEKAAASVCAMPTSITSESENRTFPVSFDGKALLTGSTELGTRITNLEAFYPYRLVVPEKFTRDFIIVGIFDGFGKRISGIINRPASDFAASKPARRFATSPRIPRGGRIVLWVRNTAFDALPFSAVLLGEGVACKAS
jgi:hypothetical protein